METSSIPIIAAIIGPTIGSIGGNLLTDLLKKKGEKDLLKREIAFKYLIQLQYSIQSLANRLTNIIDGYGWDYSYEIKNNTDYYTLTTLFSLGSVLAFHRILLLEGSMHK